MPVYGADDRSAGSAAWTEHVEPRHAGDYCVATSAEWAYDEIVSSQSAEGNHEASSFVARIVNLSRRCASHWAGGRAVAKFDAERYLQ
jgi:hypothetical protein